MSNSFDKKIKLKKAIDISQAENLKGQKQNEGSNSSKSISKKSTLNQFL